MSSLPAADEQSLFGVEPPPFTVDEPSVAEPAVAEAPRKRFAMRSVRHKAASARRGGVPGEALPETVDMPIAAEKTDLAVMELAPPPRRSSAAVAVSDGAVPSRNPSLGFSLSERTSLKVGPLSSMMPDYRADTVHGDFQERWRLTDERDAAQDAGAAVGMTFKLN